MMGMATVGYQHSDMRDWLIWLEEARTVAVAAGREHRRCFTIITAELTWTALRDRMVAAGLDEMSRDEGLFRAAKTFYQQVECEERAYGGVSAGKGSVSQAPSAEELGGRNGASA